MARRTIARVADIPVPHEAPERLFRPPRPDGDEPPSYHGSCVVSSVELLSQEGSTARRVLEDVLVLQLHSYDEQREASVAARDIDLGFWFDEDEWYEDDDPEEMDFVIVTTLTLFFERCVGRIVESLPSPPRHLVVCVCNRGRVEWSPPRGWRGPPVWVPLGDTTLEAVEQRGRMRYRARAPVWRTVGVDGPPGH